MRYLGTGGAGFIGSNIVDDLVRRPHVLIRLQTLACHQSEIESVGSHGCSCFRMCLPTHQFAKGHP
jgi:nucleoside-diphosphate-sugar epimerase